jgi:hypothetical protein
MTRLPQLEAALLEAVDRADAMAQEDRSRLPGRPGRPRPGWRRSRRVLAGVCAALSVTGVSIAATTGLLSSGDPVPDGPAAKQLPIVPAARGLTVARVRVAEPDGGPPWGVATYQASDRRGGAAITCVVVGRVQDGRLGVVGRDGVFHDDGRFHALSPRSLNETACGGGAGPLASLGPPIPASGYTGPAGGTLGGCRERVDLDGPTVSPQTRRRLRDVPMCAKASLRKVVAGLGGPSARRAVVTARGLRRTQRLEGVDGGAYLFVLPAGAADVRVRVTDAAGHPLLTLPGRRAP